MSRVYVTTYELFGDALPIAERFYANVNAAKAAHWAFVEELGGIGFRPSHDGGLRSVFFAELPIFWRKIAMDRDKIEAVPHQGSAAGKALQKRIAALPSAPRAEELTSLLGYKPESLAVDSARGTIYFPTELSVIFPRKRFFIRLPRFAQDGFEPDPNMLLALPESEFMQAIEEHNAEARRLREAGE